MGDSEKKFRKRKSTDVEEDHPEVHDESNWLVSYADMMTLLFGFFVLMYAFSKVDTEKFTVVRKEMAAYFGGKVEESPAMVKIKDNINKIMQEQKISQDDIAVTTSDTGIRLEMKNNLLFKSGSAQLSEKSLPVLSQLINLVKSQQKTIR